MSDTLDYTATAQQLGLDDEQLDTPPSNYWAHLPTEDIGAAIIDRFTRFRQWQASNGLLRGYKLKLFYYHNEYRSDPEIPHLSIMQSWGEQGQYQYVTINHLRSLLKTVLSSVCQNPPSFQTRAVNSEADALEAAALYQGVLDYYSRQLSLPKKINKAVEVGTVVDQGFILVEWDPFAVDGDSPPDQGIWKGAPSVRVLTPWDVAYDVTRSSWTDLDWQIVRDWVDKEKLKAQFPELEREIDGCRLRSEVMSSNNEYECNTRYTMTGFPDMSGDVQVFKLFMRPQQYLPDGRFVMCLENGDVLFESPAGLVYPRLPVERFVCDEQVDCLLGYSPINELLGPQEAVNTIVSSITSNIQNFANQFVACQQGTDLNPRTIADGMRIIEFPAGAPPPQGLSLVAVPSTVFEHLKEMMGYMQVVPGVSNASRGQAPGANSTGSAMLFLASQTQQNQGGMSDNYAQFSAAVMTSLLHVCRTFARTEKTINIMGHNVASKTIVLTDALKDFDEVIVDQVNPILSTPQGRLGFAQQMMQFGNASPQDAMQVALSGNLGPAVDPAREAQYEMEKENEWLLNNEQVLVNALDNHEQHIQTHARLFSTPWLRKPDLAQRLGQTNAPMVLSTIQQHIQQHMGFLQQNQTAGAMHAAGAQPGQPGAAPGPAMGGPHPPPGGPGNAQDGPPMTPQVAATAQQTNTAMPAAPGQPSMPGGNPAS